MNVAGFTSTGSKRPDALFGEWAGAPALRMTKSQGCYVWDEHGTRYIDYIMGLGAIALGYGHPEVNQAAKAAIDAGVVGALPPVLEEAVAGELRQAIPTMESVRFLKSGAEAVAAAVRLARAKTGRDHVLGCGYHGWLDWCSRGPGVPESVSASCGWLPFNDADQAKVAIRAMDDRLACVVLEPMVEAAPDPEWLAIVRAETHRVGALLVLDEVKTAFRVALGGYTEGLGLNPDLLVIGKAMANGFPLAAVGGRAEVMAEVARTWISSTLATEFVALGAARATIGIMQRDRVPAYLERTGKRLWAGLAELQMRFPNAIERLTGIPTMCALRFTSEPKSTAFARGCQKHGLFFKRTAYNFVSLAHDDATIDTTLGILEEVVKSL